MKKTLLRVSAVLLLSFQLATAFAQAPQKMSYQAVIRNASNTLVTSSSVGMQISILQGSSTGTAVYVETQTASTNANGLVTIEIGNGTAVTGTFSAIDWSAGPYFIMTETDPNGGSTYTIAGTTQLMSVPYALYAATSGNGAGATGATGATGADGINGTNGVDGLNGSDGINGTNGVDGATGATGATGVDGINGTNGTNGVDGVAGATGANGADGINGTNGVDGVAGATGATGATGAMGMAGIDGTNGSTGATGATGLAGTNGTNGTTGSTGATGAMGAQGFQGPMGPMGLSGTNGTNGTNGSTGATGATGAQGIQGTAGTAGTNGADGAVGATGATGMTGATGLLADGTAAGNTSYWNGTAWVVNSSNIYNNGGNVGIGITTPGYKLDVASPTQFIANFATTSTTDRTSIVQLRNNNTTSSAWLLGVGGTGNGIGIANGEMYIESFGAAKDFIIRNQASPLTETFRVRGSNGFVGIGTATPNAALQFGNVQGNRRLVLWEDANNDHEYYGFGMNNNALRYQVSSPVQSHVFYAATSATASNELMRILGNGNVGIGTATPNAKLMIQGSANTTQFLVRASATQTNPNPLIKLQNSAGTDVLWINSNNSQNAFIGVGAGNSTLASALNNTFVGGMAGYTNTSGNKNTAIGANALRLNTTGFQNGAFGEDALYNNTTGNYNTGVGSASMITNQTGSQNTAVGVNSLYLNNGSFNTAVGTNAIRNNTSGNNNVGLGFSVLLNNSTGVNNTAAGTNALLSNTIGNQNTSVGSVSLYNNTTGNENTAVGDGALYNNTSGPYNTAVGAYALYSNGGAFWNTAVGHNSLRLSNANYNTAVGAQALRSASTGAANVAMGVQALEFTTTGTENVGFGVNANSVNTTGSYNTAIGNNCGPASGLTNLQNTTSIGFGANVTASNMVRIGNTSVTVIQGQVPFSNPSDARFKYNVQSNVPGLDFITKLQPVTYFFDEQGLAIFSETGKLDNSHRTDAKAVNTGFLAQDVEKLCKELNYKFDGVHVPTSENDHYSLAYSQFIMPLVKAVQEQQVIIMNLKKVNSDAAADQKAMLDRMIKLEELVKAIKASTINEVSASVK